MDWQDRFNAALEYIENNLGGELEWRDAAAEANCSTFHFLRMFEVIAGVSPGEYVRRRRLSLAALMLAQGDTKVIDLALAAGYDSPEAFTRAFKREFGLSPTEARNRGVALKTWPRLAFSVVLKGDTPMDYRIEEHGDIALTGLPLRTKNLNGEHLRDLPAFWDRVKRDGSLDRLLGAMPRDAKLGCVGASAGDFDERTKEFTYLIAIETPRDRSRIPPGCVDVKADAGSWAIFECRGNPSRSVSETFRRIWSEWMPGSGYEYRGGPEMEVYPEGDVASPDYRCEVWIPVRKKESER